MQHPKSATPSKSYPFRTRRQIAHLLHSDRAFARQCIEIMLERQTARDSSATVDGAMGWGSSDATRVAMPVQRILDGSDDDGDWEQVLCILDRYTKQLAQHFRERQLKANPALAEVAALYGVSVVTKASDLSHPGPLPFAPEAQQGETIQVSPTAPQGALAEAPTSEAAPLPEQSAAATHESVPPAASTGIATTERSPLENTILAYLTRNERGTTTAIAERTRRSRDTVLETLRQLEAQGDVVRTGTGRWTFYSLSAHSSVNTQT